MKKIIKLTLTAILITLVFCPTLKLKAKTVLVTGGSGFLGSHLCERLLDLGHKVIAVDNLQTSEIKNIEHLIGNQNFKFIKHDIVKPITPKTIDPEDVKIDWIFNAACPASPDLYQKKPIHTMKTCVYGAINMLKLAKKHGARIMQFSTSEVYGDPKEHPQKETYLGNVNTIGPRSCYDEGKRAAETIFFDYNRKYKTEIKVIRIFNTYGPRMSKYDGRVVSNFINNALEGKNLEVYGDGSQTRSFCFVSDLIDGIIAMMDSEKKFTGPVNLGNPQEITILELAQTVIKITNSSSKIIFKPLPKDDPTKRRPDITLSKTILNWKPRVTLEEGLRNYIEFIVKNKKQ